MFKNILKRLFPLFSLFLALFMGAEAFATPADEAKIFDGLVRIRTISKASEILDFGTAFYISENKLLTAANLMDEAFMVVLTLRDDVTEVAISVARGVTIHDEVAEISITPETLAGVPGKKSISNLGTRKPLQILSTPDGITKGQIAIVPSMYLAFFGIPKIQFQAAEWNKDSFTTFHSTLTPDQIEKRTQDLVIGAPLIDKKTLSVVGLIIENDPRDGLKAVRIKSK